MKHFISLHSLVLALIAFTTVGITSCSEKLFPDEVISDKDVIKFSVANPNNGTRTAFNSKNYAKELKNFYVSAFYDNPREEEPYMDQVEIVNDGNGNFNYKKKAEKKPWINGEPLHFVAASSLEIMGGYRPSINVWENHNEAYLDIYNGGDKDYMVAFEPNISKETNHGIVNLQFHHLLSQVKFGVSNLSDRYEIVDIKKIGLRGVYDDATFTVKGNGEIEAHEAQDTWGVGDYSFEINDYKNSNKSYLNDKKDIFIVPLNHKTFDPNLGISIKSINEAIKEGNAENTYSYVWAECKIYDHKDEKFVVGDNNTYGYTYFPFKVNLKAGKSYKYTIAITNDFIGYPDQNTTLQEPKLGWIISDAGNIYQYCEDAVKAGEEPVAMIAYISPNGSGPSPYKKHGLAIALRDLRKDKSNPEVSFLFHASEMDHINIWLSQDINIGKAPFWTQWYLPRFKDFDLIFDACGGTKYNSQPHYGDQPWDYGKLEDLLERTEPSAEKRGSYRYINFFVIKYNVFPQFFLGHYWLNPLEKTDSSLLWFYNSINKQYCQWSCNNEYDLYCWVRPVFEF